MQRLKTVVVMMEDYRCQVSPFPKPHLHLQFNGIILLSQTKIRFSPPSIPEDYTPIAPTLGAPILGPSRTPLAPKDRGALLGEKPLPGKSVFSFLSPEARAQISQATGKTNLPAALNETGPSSSKSRGTVTAKSNLPSVPKETAIAALNGGFMPYGDNLDKQKRYRAYLEIQAELSERPLTRVILRVTSLILACIHEFG